MAKFEFKVTVHYSLWKETPSCLSLNKFESQPGQFVGRNFCGGRNVFLIVMDKKNSILPIKINRIAVLYFLIEWCLRSVSFPMVYSSSELFKKLSTVRFAIP